MRVDTHSYSGYKIPPYYDSMIGKLIVHGNNRAEALAICRRALGEFVIEGVKTTIPFQMKIINHKDFAAGKYDTGFVEKMLLDKKSDSKNKEKK